MQKPSILLFTDWYEPGYKAGGPIQSCKNLVSLLKEKYAFYIFCSDRDLGDPVPYENILANEWTKVDNDVRVWYASPTFLTRKNIRNLVEEVKPDKVYFNSMYSEKFTILPLRVLFRNNFAGKMVLAPRGMLHKGAMQKKTLKKKLFLRMFRYSGAIKKITFHATDTQEENDIRHYLSKGARVIIARDTPNLARQEFRKIDKEPGQLSCIFVSRIHPKKNLLFFINLLGRLDLSMKVRFDIYGSSEDESYYNHCRQAAASLGKNIEVRFQGPLRYGQVLDAIRSCHLFVLPTLGENFGHAIFESLSVGRPVLISDQTPWRELPGSRAGWDLPLDQPEQFRKVLVDAVQSDQELFDDWSYHAWKFADDYITRSNPVEEYKKLFE